MSVHFSSESTVVQGHLLLAVKKQNKNKNMWSMEDQFVLVICHCSLAAPNCEAVFLPSFFLFSLIK